MTQKRRRPEGYDDMTHDELLADITAEASGWANSHGLTNNYLEALRAVVELHKPMLWKNLGNDTQGYLCTVCDEEVGGYPCPTIQAIEKELK